MAAISGGSIADALQAAAFAFAQVHVWDEVGQFLDPIKRALGGVSAAFSAVKGAVHGVVGGALSVAQGGSFVQGFAANAIGAATGVFANGIASNNIALHTALVASAGCGAAVLSGGKCANGAATAGFANLYNHFRLKGKDYVNPWDIGNDAHRTLQNEREKVGAGFFSERWWSPDGSFFAGRVDLGNVGTRELWEIKPHHTVGVVDGLIQMLRYIGSSGYNYGGTSVFDGAAAKTIVGDWATYNYQLVAPGIVTYTHTPHPGVESQSFPAYWGKFHTEGPGAGAVFALPGRGRLPRPGR